MFQPAFSGDGTTRWCRAGHDRWERGRKVPGVFIGWSKGATAWLRKGLELFSLGFTPKILTNKTQRERRPRWRPEPRPVASEPV